MNELRKALQILRIQHDEMMADMAAKLGISASMLSAIERGKRRLSDGFVGKIIRTYELSGKDEENLRLAIARDEGFVRMDVLVMALSDESIRELLAFKSEIPHLCGAEFKPSAIINGIEDALPLMVFADQADDKSSEEEE